MFFSASRLRRAWEASFSTTWEYLRSCKNREQTLPSSFLSPQAKGWVKIGKIIFHTEVTDPSQTICISRHWLLVGDAETFIQNGTSHMWQIPHIPDESSGFLYGSINLPDKNVFPVFFAPYSALKIISSFAVSSFSGLGSFIIEKEYFLQCGDDCF